MVEPLCRLDELVDTTVLQNKKMMVVTSIESTEAFVYLMEGHANRDRIRSSFAKLTKTKFVNTRSRKL